MERENTRASRTEPRIRQQLEDRWRWGCRSARRQRQEGQEEPHQSGSAGSQEQRLFEKRVVSQAE